MSKSPAHSPCPVEAAGSLDTWYRRWLQSPYSILKKYIKPGMRALDFGCGPGYFSFPMAEMLGEQGELVVADLQQGMLDIVEKRITEVDKPMAKISVQKVSALNFSLTGSFDFILAFYVLHEVEDIHAHIETFWQHLKPGGCVLAAEPGIGKITFSHFSTTLDFAEEMGFEVERVGGVFLASTAILRKPLSQTHN